MITLTKPYCPLVQRTAYEQKEPIRVKVPDINGREEKKEMRRGFINIAHMDVEKVFLDNRQISKLRFLPKRQVACGDIYERDENLLFKKYRKTEGGELVEDPNGTERKRVETRQTRVQNEKWLAYFATTETVEEISSDFVLDNFPETFLSQVRSIGATRKNLLLVPPGASRSHRPGSIVASSLVAPVIKYKQKMGETNCLTALFASALHFVGLRKIANELFRGSKKIINRHDSCQRFMKFLVHKSKYLSTSKYRSKFCEIFDIKKEQLMSVILQGSDGKCDHAVAICGRWIFDSNFDNALELSKESFDLCCSSDEVEATFVKIVWGRFFPEYNKEVKRTFKG